MGGVDGNAKFTQEKVDGRGISFETAIKVPGEPALSEYSAASILPGVFAYFRYALISERTPVFPATNAEAPFLFALIRF